MRFVFRVLPLTLLGCGLLIGDDKLLDFGGEPVLPPGGNAKTTPRAEDIEMSPATGPFGTNVQIRATKGADLSGASVYVGEERIGSDSSGFWTTPIRATIPVFKEGTEFTLRFDDGRIIQVAPFQPTWRAPRVRRWSFSELASAVGTSKGVLVLARATYGEIDTTSSREGNVYFFPTHADGKVDEPISLGETRRFRDAFVLPTENGALEGLMIANGTILRVSSVGPDLPSTVPPKDVTSDFAWAGENVAEKSLWVIRTAGAQRVRFPDGSLIGLPVPLPSGFSPWKRIVADAEGTLYVLGQRGSETAILRLSAEGSAFEEMPATGGRALEVLTGGHQVIARRLSGGRFHDMLWNEALRTWIDTGEETVNCSEGSVSVHGEALQCVKDGDLVSNLTQKESREPVGLGDTLVVESSNGETVLVSATDENVFVAVRNSP